MARNYSKSFFNILENSKNFYHAMHVLRNKDIEDKKPGGIVHRK